MQPTAGHRDMLITFQERSGSQEATFGTTSYTWGNLVTDPTEWADVEQLGVSRGEFVADGVKQAVKKYRIELLYRSDITSEMRIVLPEGDILRIISEPQQLGRRAGLRLMCEEYATEGEEP